MTNFREEIRQWLLLLIGFSGIVYEGFWQHADRPALLSLYGLMVGLSQADKGLQSLQKILAFKVQTKSIALRYGETPPTLEIPEPPVIRPSSESTKEISQPPRSTGLHMPESS